MHESLEFAPTLEIQHFRLVTMRDEYEKLPLDYASYQVHIGQLTEAIATLEQGKGLLWSEMRGFRTSAHLLRKVDSPLAEKFAAMIYQPGSRGADNIRLSKCLDKWRKG
jgi:hypothetical protein